LQGTLPDLERNRVAERRTVRGGRIVRIEVFLDASPCQRLFEA
jgi:ketosteroid isomerase-like protein